VLNLSTSLVEEGGVELPVMARFVGGKLERCVAATRGWEFDLSSCSALLATSTYEMSMSVEMRGGHQRTGTGYGCLLQCRD
jgi:hypothetical protein